MPLLEDGESLLFCSDLARCGRRDGLHAGARDPVSPVQHSWSLAIEVPQVELAEGYWTSRQAIRKRSSLESPLVEDQLRGDWSGLSRTSSVNRALQCSCHRPLGRQLQETRRSLSPIRRCVREVRSLTLRQCPALNTSVLKGKGADGKAPGYPQCERLHLWVKDDPASCART